MPQATVDDVDLLHTLIERFQTALDLGDHAGGDRAVSNHPPRLGRCEGVDKAFRIVDILKHAGNIAENHQFFRTDRCCHRRGGRVGIDVEFLPIRPHGHRRDHRHLTGIGEIVDRQPVDAGDGADIPEVDRRSSGTRQRQLLAEEHIGGEEVERHRPAAVLLNFRGKIMVEFRGQHLLHDLKRGGIGVAASLHKSGHQPGGIHRPIDRLAAAMHQHNPHPEGRHEDHIDQQVAEGIGMFHNAPPQFDHCGCVAELANPPERLDERVGLLDRLRLNAGWFGRACHEKRTSR